MQAIYKLYIFENGTWQDTCERGTKQDLLSMMADCPYLYAKAKTKFVKCKDQSPLDRAEEIIGLLNGYVRG